MSNKATEHQLDAPPQRPSQPQQHEHQEERQTPPTQPAAPQKQRVLNTVRMLYYEALGAQQRVDLRVELARIAREAVKTTAELMNVGQADRSDYLESEIEAQ